MPVTENSLLGRETRIVLGQPQKLFLHSPVRFKHFACAVEKKSLRRMESSEICVASSVFAKPDTEHRRRVFQKLTRFGEEAHCFRRHNSRPSRRISCMSGERS